jgi:hypothetical protein
MYCYQAYGLGIHSQFNIFDFPTVEAARDVLIQKDIIPSIGVEDETIRPYLRISTNETILSAEEVGLFQIREGNEIIIDPSQKANYPLLLRYLVGPAIAILLYQRGRLILHASSVSINGKGVLFMGGSGTGKSSTAAAFLSSKNAFIVDDVASIDIEDNDAWIYPGFPQIKLDDESAKLLARSPHFHYMDNIEGKRSFYINSVSETGKIALKHIYVLLNGDQVKIERLKAQKAIIEIVRHSIPPSVVRMDNAEHLAKCLNLITQVPVSGLWRSNSLNNIEEIVSRVNDDINT